MKRAIALEDGPILLVGHSYGGVVITQAGVDSPQAATAAERLVEVLRQLGYVVGAGPGVPPAGSG